MGAAASLFSEALPPASKFSVDDIPDLTGKVAIVTGANTGTFKLRVTSANLSLS